MLPKINSLPIYLIAGLLVAQAIESKSHPLAPLAAVVASVGLITIGYWWNDKVAENQNRQLIADVKDLDPATQFQQLFSLIDYAQNNDLDPITVIANAYSEKKNILDVQKLNTYFNQALSKINNLETHAALWKNKEQALYEQASLYVNGEKGEQLKNKLLRLQKLATSMNKLEPYFKAYAYFNQINNKSYNHDGSHFPLVGAVKEMQDDCEKLASHKEKLRTAVKNALEYADRYNDLIYVIDQHKQQLKQSIVNIRNSNDYQDQLKNHELREERDKLLKIQEQNVENERERIACEKLKQKNYQRRMEIAEKRSDEYREEKEKCLEKLEQEKEKNKKLREELKKLEERAAQLEKELEKLKKIEQAESKMIEELNKKDVELTILRQKIQEIQLKINNGTLPVNPFSEDGTNFLMNFIMSL